MSAVQETDFQVDLAVAMSRNICRQINRDGGKIDPAETEEGIRIILGGVRVQKFVEILAERQIRETGALDPAAFLPKPEIDVASQPSNDLVPTTPTSGEALIRSGS